MRRGVLLLALIAATASLAPGGTAAWLMLGYDAAYTGAVAGGGPATEDVAFTVRIPGGTPPSAWTWRPGPILHNGSAYVLAGYNYQTHPEPLGTANGTFRVDLATGAVEQSHAFPAYPQDWVSDGERILVAFADQTIRAYPLRGGDAVWEWRFPQVIPGQKTNTCQPPVVHDGTAYFPCSVHTEGGFLAQSDGILVALDAATGEQRWVWHRETVDEVERRETPLPASAVDAPLSSNLGSVNVGVAVIGDFAYVVTVEGGNRGGVMKPHLWALRASDGSLAWVVNGPTAPEDRPSRYVPQDLEEEALRRVIRVLAPSMPTGTPETLFMEFERLTALAPATGKTLWDEDIRSADADGFDGGSGLALADGAVFVASGQTIYRFDATRSGPPVWSYTLPIEPLAHWDRSGLIVADGRVYARGVYGNLPEEAASGYFVQVLDAATREPLWRRDFPMPMADSNFQFNPHYSWAVDEGVLVMVRFDGEVTVIGHTPASPRPAAIPSTEYPQPGEEVTLDLSASGAGIHGAVTRYRVDWGDGTVADWQSAPVFTHTYAEAGERVARAQAANDANQTASTFVTFRVGESPPAPPPQLTFMQRVFAPENQEWTFFVLGLAITGAGALVGIAQLRRRRSVLRRELERLERAHAAATTAEARKRALASEKERLRGLLMAGKVTETQFTVLSERVQELLRSARDAEASAPDAAPP